MQLDARVDRLETAVAELAEAHRDFLRVQGQIETHLVQLAAAQQRTEQRLEQLAAAQQRTETQLAQLVTAQEQAAAQLARLAAAQQRTETQLASLLSWQQGESGRREGERFERDVVRGALALFAGGEGGTPDQPWVYAWLAPLLMQLLKDGTVDLPPEADPTRADLLWRKGSTVAVVEISKVVDEYDVRRAHKRAETLRRAVSRSAPSSPPGSA